MTKSEPLKVLVYGGNGFLGRHIVAAFKAHGHHVWSTARHPETPDMLAADLHDRESVARALEEVSPNIVINAAGVISGGDFHDNVTFSQTILDVVSQAVLEGLVLRRVIICGSAGVYGQVEPEELPVSESTPLRASSPYGMSKREEEELALRIAREQHLPVVVARIFNPIGPGAGSRLLTARLAAQIDEIRNGMRQKIELSRLDAVRDFIDARDVGDAFVAIAEGDPSESVYNVGLGRSTTLKEVAELMLQESKLSVDPPIVETSDQPEPTVASQADITRLRQDFHWEPRYTLKEMIVNSK